MILTVLRIYEFGELPNPLICDDADFNSAIEITRVLIQHTSRIFMDLPQSPPSNPITQTTQLRQRFLEALPTEFDRATYLSVAQRFAIPPKTAEKMVTAFQNPGRVIHEAQNKYRKP